MKKLEFAALLMVAALFVSCGMFKKTSNNSKQITHMMESKSLIGVWQQCSTSQLGAGNGSIRKIKNYKIINADNTLYTLFDSNGNLVCGFYGSYQMTSDSTLTEKIFKHGQNRGMSGSESQLRFKMIDENTIALKYFNSSINNWIPEVWVRVQLYGTAGYQR